MTQNVDKEVVNSLIEKIKNKDLTFYLFVHNYKLPTASVNEVYFHAKVLKEAGYRVVILTDDSEYVKPEWLDSDLLDVEIKFVGDENNKLTIKPEDFLVIPEVLTNVMEATKNLTNCRIVLLQSFDGAIGSLAGGLNYSYLNIYNVLTTNNKLANLANTYLGPNLNIKTYTLGIPEYFKKSDKPKKPLISFVTRNANDLTKTVKMFFNKYPLLKWVTFEELSDLSREDFAAKLGESFMVVWFDKLASHGTLPLEAMKSDTIVAGVIPDIAPEYINDKNGIWVENAYELVDVIAECLSFFLEDNVPQELYDGMKSTVEKYTIDISKKSIIEKYTEFINERVKLVEDLVKEEK